MAASTRGLPAVFNSQSRGQQTCVRLGGEQLVRGPSVLLLDEPLAGLDWRARRHIADLLGVLGVLGVLDMLGVLDVLGVLQ